MNEDAVHQAGLAPIQPDFDRIAALQDKKELSSAAHFS